MDNALYKQACSFEIQHGNSASGVDRGLLEWAPIDCSCQKRDVSVGASSPHQTREAAPQMHSHPKTIVAAKVCSKTRPGRLGPSVNRSSQSISLAACNLASSGTKEKSPR